MNTSERRTQDPIAWIGRYALFDELARGGMASVHVGRLRGPVGFAKTVAIKKMLGGFADSPQLLAMFLDEARLAGRIQHPNVVSVFDVIAEGDAAYLVMQYVDGLPLSELCRVLFERGERVAPAIAVHIMRDVLYGLQAAHEATNEKGESLQLVHRDVSPQNILVGADGATRVLDFGVAKAVGRQQDTDAGQIKGKVSYMAPEQLLGQPIDRRVDVFSAGVVLWEALAGKRLFPAKNSAEAMYRVLEDAVPMLTEIAPDVPAPLAQIVARATARAPRERFGSALELAVALEGSVELIPNHVVGRWVLEIGGDMLGARRARVRAIEAISIPPEPEAPTRSTRVAGTTTASFVPALPDEVTRADAPITVASEVPLKPSQSMRLGLAVAALVAGGVVWLLIARPHSLGSPGAGGPTKSLAPEPAAQLTAPSGVVSSVPLAPSSTLTTVPSVVPSAAPAHDKPRAGPARERTRKPAEPAKAGLPAPESLFSRE